jgi:2,3-bisphosphoglycerate-dependent phosphoglycerate mutase
MPYGHKMEESYFLCLNKRMPHVLIARHGQSEYNAKNLFTGITDVPLTDLGRIQASRMAESIKDLKPDVAFASKLGRAKETLEIIMVDNGWDDVDITYDAALNERDYGDLTGKNKLALAKEYGQAQFDRWRRGWDEPVPNGETLKTVYRRVVLYYEATVMPVVKKGSSVLLVAHGNTLRALVKHLDWLDDHAVEKLEFPLQEVIIYNYEVRIASKQVRKTDATTLPFVTVNSTYIKE